MIKNNHNNTINNFGEQFSLHNNIDGYFGSLEMLQDIVFPFDLNLINNKIIAEIGVGSGRILKNLLNFNPNKIYAIEPSKAIKLAKNNINDDKKIVKFINTSCQKISFNKEIDYIFSLGVIHHIPEAEDSVKKIYESLKSKGKFVLWLYGKEGNELYLLIFNNLRKVTRLIPDKILNIISSFLNYLLIFYIFLCRFFNLPLKKYLINVFQKCSWDKRRYIIFDQLNPSYTKYYSKNDVKNLLKNCGFEKFEIHHRHHYSWLVIAEK